MRASLSKGASVKVQKGGIFYGWWMVGIAIISSFSAMSIGQAIPGVFMEPMTQDFDWPISHFYIAISCGTVMGGLMAVIVGPLVDKHGPRRLMMFGAICCSAGLLGLSNLSSLWQFILLQSVCGALGWTFFSPLVVNTSLNKWFVTKRGWALALGSAGISLGGIITPKTMTLIVDNADWRTGYITLAIAVIVIIIPSALMMRSRPEDYGQLPDGVNPDEISPEITLRRAAIAADDRQSYTRALAIRTPGFWLLILGFGLNGAALSSVLLHAIPFATAFGFTRSLAAWGVSINGFGNLCSKFVWGWGLQRINARVLVACAFPISATGVLTLLIAAHQGNTLLLFAGFYLYGFGFGGSVPLSEFLFARYFGRKHIGAIRGFGIPVSLICSAGAPVLTGVWVDTFGSYTGAFMLIMCLYLTGAVVINISREPPPLYVDAQQIEDKVNT